MHPKTLVGCTTGKSPGLAPLIYPADVNADLAIAYRESRKIVEIAMQRRIEPVFKKDARAKRSLWKSARAPI